MVIASLERYNMYNNTTVLALIIAGLIVGGGAGYFLAPGGNTNNNGTQPVTVDKLPLDGKTIKIGYISSATVSLETATPLVKNMMVPDYNEYAKLLGYDVTFDYLVDDAASQPATHLEKVQGFKAIDVNTFIGGLWSSQAQAALSYVNDNDMLMWSASSTSPLLAIPDDNLYRMCPTDLVQAPAISEMLKSYGIKAVVIIYRGDAWADGIVNIFEPEFTSNDGVVLEKIRYAGEATEFSNYLQTAENIVSQAVEKYGHDKVAVEVIAFQEFVTMITQAEDYPTLYSLPWFGSDGTVLVQQAIDDAPRQSSKLHVFSTYAAPAESQKFSDLSERYFALVSQPFGYYSACTYDIGWILATSMLESQSTDALDIIPLQAPTAFNQWGSSGWNRLNADGDRYASNYQIWGYGDLGQGVQNVVYGLYDSQTGTVTWNTELLGFTPESV
jgi:branched-chain amino acid transport system substrate-binding protein